jgi:hypothetical protein
MTTSVAGWGDILNFPSWLDFYGAPNGHYCILKAIVDKNALVWKKRICI